jgi:hypothetical protein
LTWFHTQNSSENAVAAVLLRMAFSTVPEVNFFLFQLPNSISSIYSPLNNYFDIIKTSTDLLKGRVGVCERGPRVGPFPLKVRLARVEDHDDLAPIFNSSNLIASKSESDKFFLANLLENQSLEQKTLVGEVLH